jgi:hypothetical protein
VQLAVMPLIGLERVVFYRERAASYYNPWAYGLVISLVELPYQIVQVQHNINDLGTCCFK